MSHKLFKCVSFSIAEKQCLYVFLAEDGECWAAQTDHTVMRENNRIDEGTFFSAPVDSDDVPLWGQKFDHWQRLDGQETPEKT